jgi:hypothetical protein
MFAVSLGKMLKPIYWQKEPQIAFLRGAAALLAAFSMFYKETANIEILPVGRVTESVMISKPLILVIYRFTMMAPASVLSHALAGLS